MVMFTAEQMSNTEYHATDAISSSAVKTVHGKSLAHWKARSNFTATTAMAIGTCVHDMCLEDGQGVMRGPADRRGNAWKDAFADAEAGGKLLLTAGDYDLARNVADSVLFHPVGQIMAGNDTVNEASFFATDPETGLELKCRPDSYRMSGGGIVYDIKTCQSSLPRDVARDVNTYSYALQAAFYLKVLRLAGYEANRFSFVFVEKTAPYAVNVSELSDDFLQYAEREVDATLMKIAEASLVNRFDTGYSDKVNTLELPRWLQADNFDNN